MAELVAEPTAFHGGIHRSSMAEI